MQGTNPKISFIVTFQKKRWLDNNFDKKLVVSQIKFEYEEIWIIVEGLGDFGLWNSLCTEGNLKSAKKKCLHKKIFAISWSRCQPKILRKQNLINDTNQPNKQILGFSKHLVSLKKERNSKLQIWNNLPNWSECLNRRQRYAENEIEKQKQSYAKQMEKNKEHISRKMNWEGEFEGKREYKGRIITFIY